MFGERHSYIYDPFNRVLFDGFNLPGWHKIGEGEKVYVEKLGKEVTRYYAGWMVMYNAYYMAILGRYNNLYIQNLGYDLITSEEFPIQKIPPYHGPLPELPLVECIIL